ncbi:PEP/pyruvate-binding domain-containing protein [Bdellovibrionota bacterium FG-2]
MDRLQRFRVDDTFDSHVQRLQQLMPCRIRDILLVSSLYDSYLLEEDGRLYEAIRKEYQGLNLIHSPEIRHATSGREALELLREKQFDLIITTLHIEDMHAVTFANAVRAEGRNTPIVLLLFDNRERKDLVSSYDISIFERMFIWQGDYRLLVAIVKYLEDRMNVENDTRIVGVQSIILIENNVKFYSSYLPIIYTEILKHSQRLISEGVNLTDKFLRMRARPKILLCTTYDEAWAYFEKYSEYILGVISDVNFRRDGKRDARAGIEFVKAVRAQHLDIPALLQSSAAKHAESAREIGASFVEKGSALLLHELRAFITNQMGFGDFVFRMPDGQTIGTAKNLKMLEDLLKTAPGASIVYHGERNHFSAWLKARTEFSLANKLRPRKVTDSSSAEDLRKFLLEAVLQYQESRKRGIITDFAKDTFDPRNSFARIGEGSLGGKARGLAFMNRLITNYRVNERFEGVSVFVPSSIAIATNVFDEFMETNKLLSFAMECADDEEITRRFLEAKEFPKTTLRKLTEYLEIVRSPLAVRSSSLLEDSQYQPFAGVYETYMIPNNSDNPKTRLRELLDSVKRVYASTFYKNTKAYIKATEYRLEEEKMAVIVQQMVGSERDSRFYPDFSGVAKSYNFYPTAPQKASDGIAIIALGLGKTVVDGGNAVRFCPKYPKHLLQFFSTKETLRNAQQDFFALNLAETSETNTSRPEDICVQRFSLEEAEKDGALTFCGSTYSPENDCVYDGISRKGRRIVTFAPILKHKLFPLPEVLDIILALGRWGMGSPIEIEFAVNLAVPLGAPKEFGLLQMRPLVLNSEIEVLDVENVAKEDLLIQSVQALGNGAIQDVFDVVVVDFERFDRGKSKEVAFEVAALNAKLLSEKRHYILIGVGRWGSLDPWLGIPVTWDQISNAAAIVESDFKDLDVTPSQGSHFFQNLISFRIGYFTVNAFTNQGYIDWKWLSEQPALEELRYTRHLRFEHPLVVKINGRKNMGVILKPVKTVSP